MYTELLAHPPPPLTSFQPDHLVLIHSLAVSPAVCASFPSPASEFQVKHFCFSIQLPTLSVTQSWDQLAQRCGRLGQLAPGGSLCARRVSLRLEGQPEPGGSACPWRITLHLKDHPVPGGSAYTWRVTLHQEGQPVPGWSPCAWRVSPCLEGQLVGCFERWVP